MECSPALLLPNVSGNAGLFPHSLRRTRLDDRDSQSGSDDGTNGHFPDLHRSDIDADEENNSLTSQSLNADGTPKRPMNAFMIFARRRRPQVSAENQSMRTGEISKILSREWNSMESIEKQFYLEQAKQLKETFNNKYPDYVYRRRPNNSRKRRRGDGHARPQDNRHPSDPCDDALSGLEPGEGSPVDSEDLESSADFSFPRFSNHHLPPLDSHNFFAPHAGGSSYSYSSSETLYRPAGTSGSRIPSIDDRGMGSLSSISTLGARASEHGQSSPYHRYLSTPDNHMRLSSVNRALHHSTRGTADNRSDHEVLAPPATWLDEDRDRVLSSLRTPRSHSYPSPSAHNLWAAVEPQAGSTSCPAELPFPTLSSPFYPSQTVMPDSYLNGVSSSSSRSSSASQYSSSSGHIKSEHYDYQGFAAPSVPSHVYTSSVGREGLEYEDHESRFSRIGDTQSISDFSDSQAMRAPSPSSRGQSSQLGHWSRGRMQGR